MLEWSLHFSLSQDDIHYLLYRSEHKGKGVQMEIHTPVLKNGKFGKPKVAYFVDGDDKQYENENDMLASIE